MRTRRHAVVIVAQNISLPFVEDEAEVGRKQPRIEQIRRVRLAGFELTMPTPLSLRASAIVFARSCWQAESSG